MSEVLPAELHPAHAVCQDLQHELGRPPRLLLAPFGFNPAIRSNSDQWVVQARLVGFDTVLPDNSMSPDEAIETALTSNADIVAMYAPTGGLQTIDVANVMHGMQLAKCDARVVVAGIVTPAEEDLYRSWGVEDVYTQRNPGNVIPDTLQRMTQLLLQDKVRYED